ncbi:hypothetical protein [Elizabethkingia ursingii]
MKKEGLEYYYCFIGKEKSEIFISLDGKFSYYPDNIWICEMQNSWWGQKIFLIFKFDERDILKNIIVEILLL